MKHYAHKNRLDYAAVTKIAFTSQGHKTQRFMYISYYLSFIGYSHSLVGTSHMTAATQGGPRKNNSAYKVESEIFGNTNHFPDL